MRTAPRIAVIGSANVDVTTFAATFPRPGETLFGSHADVGFGGKGANQAVAARRCGAEVTLLARTGDDLFGVPTREHYAALGIDVAQVRQVPGLPSGTAAIFVEPGGENRIIVVRGANDALRPADIDAAEPVLRAADALILQLEIPIDTVYHALDRARAWGVRTLLNPAPAAPLDMERVRLADWLIPNETEAASLVRFPIATVDDARRAAEALLAGGQRRVILTLGDRGALLAHPGCTERIPAFAVAARDTTGAGDAFIGSFATFLCEGMTELEAARRACLYAALSVTEVGAQKSFPARDRFEAEWCSRSANTA
jgi:ribokinase